MNPEVQIETITITPHNWPGDWKWNGESLKFAEPFPEPCDQNRGGGRLMSGRLVGEVLRYAPADLRPLDLLVLVSLAESAHDRDRTARRDSSADAIAYRVRSTPGYVRQCLIRLKQRGIIRPEHDRTYRGRAQNWILTDLSDYHREGATL